MKIIKLTKGVITVVDDEDFEMLNLVSWCACGKNGEYYAINGSLGLMHKYLMPVKHPYEIDHIDGNKLNNQKSNLRICTKQQNQFNRKKSKNCASIYKGIYWSPVSKKWVSQIYISGERFHLGSFKDEIEAAKTYDKHARIHFKEFARPNFAEVTL